MYGAICDVVDLLTHENMDVVAAVCSLIEVIVLFDENFNILINEGAIENLVNLVTKVCALLYNYIKQNDHYQTIYQYAIFFVYRIT